MATRPRVVRASRALRTWIASGLALAFASTPARAESPALAKDDSPGPRLVVLLVVDQLRRDRLDDSLPGGLGRLAREGRVFVDGIIDHAATETCPGHVSLATGRHPGPAGAPQNRFVDVKTGQRTYCVEDPSPEAAVFGIEHGRSPALIRVSGLGDWLKAAHPGARVYSFSGKDRAAITMGGRRPDGAWWFGEDEFPGFTTSRYYADAWPDWVREWNGSDPPRDGFWLEVPVYWTPDPKLSGAPGRPDDFAAEWSEYGRSGERRIRDDDPAELGQRFYRSPYLDEFTLAFASEWVRRESLGRGPAPDLLALSLSATDTVGHLYGPESHEAHDALVRLDAALGAFLAELEAQVGAGRVLVALSSDHGVLSLPEWLAETGRSECPVAGGRVGLTWLGLKLLGRLHWRFGHAFSWPDEWLTFSGYQATVNRALAAEHGVSVDEVVAYARELLEAEPAIARVWTRRDILEGEGERARLYRNSYDPERSGDLAIELVPTCLITPGDEGTTHGTPNAYDREVPIVLWGPGVTPGRVSGTARTVDVAPTLAELLGIPAPRELDGRSLPLR